MAKIPTVRYIKQGSKTPRDARQIVLDSAIEEFATRGYSGASVQDILKATRLSKPTLYYYFDSKAGLYKAILDFAYEECLSRVQVSTSRAKGIEAKLTALTVAIFEFANDHPQLVRIVYAAIFAATEEIPADCADNKRRRLIFDYVQSVIAEAVRSRELAKGFSVEEMTHGIYGAISHQTRMHLLCGEGKLDAKAATRVVTLFLQGALRK